MTFPLAASTMSYHSHPFEDSVKGIAGAGFRGIELAAVPGWTEHIDFDTPSGAILETVEGAGLTAVSISAHADLTTEAGVAHGIRAVRWAAEHHIPFVNTAIGGRWSDPDDEAAFMRNIGGLADAAGAAGVVIGLEIDGEMMPSGAASLPLIERIGREEIGVNYDTANCEYESGVKAVEDLQTILPYVVHIHLKDTTGGKGNWDFPAVGDGTVDFHRVLAILGDAGYQGPCSVEVEFQGEPWPPLAEVDRAMTSSYRHLSSLGLR